MSVRLRPALITGLTLLILGLFAHASALAQSTDGVEETAQPDQADDPATTGTEGSASEGEVSEQAQPESASGDEVTETSDDDATADIAQESDEDGGEAADDEETGGEGDQDEGDEEVVASTEPQPDVEQCERDILAEKRAEAEKKAKEAVKANKAKEDELDAAKKEFIEIVERYTDAAVDYKRESYKIVKLSVNKQRDWIEKSYGDQLSERDVAQRQRRMESIERFEKFIRRYPKHPEHTPDAMFRLAELYYERAQVRESDALDTFEEERFLYLRGKRPDEPIQPEKDISDAVKTYKRLIKRFGKNYRYADAVYYLLGIVLEETGDDDGARKAWIRLVTQYPKSQFASEANLRIGEMYFDFAEFEDAMKYYRKVLTDVDSPHFDKALYKLGWSYFQEYDYDSAIKTFKRLIAWYDTGKRGGKLGAALREEAIEYLALSLADDDWDSDGEIDPNAGVERGLSYLQGGTTWEREVVKAYAKGLFDLQDNKKWQEAIAVYQHLLKTDPLDLEGPEYVKRLIQMHQETDNTVAAAAARRQLVDMFGEKSAWWKKHATTADFRRRMELQLEEAMYRTALDHNRRAQALKVQALQDEDDALMEEALKSYRLAVQAYKDYLSVYPGSPSSYEMTYYLAEALSASGEDLESAAVFEKVVNHPHQSEYRERSAYMIIVGLEAALESQSKDGTLDLRFVPGSDWSPEAPAVVAEGEEGEDPDAEGSEEASKEPPSPKPIQRLDLPESVQRWVGAVDSFVQNDFRVNGSREIQGNKAYFAAEIYYRAEDFDEARRRFQQILSCYPGDTIAANAVVNIIMSYKREEDWTNLELWADRADRLQLGDPELQAEIRGEIKKFKLTQLLNKADALMKAEKFLQAARDFEKLASQNPDAPWAGEAYFNAAEAYKKEQFYDSAARLFELLVTDSRYNTASFIETSWFEYAETNALFFNFEKAQQAYSTHYDRFPESPNRKYVLTRRILMQEASGDIRATAESLEAFADLYPDDAENAILSAIDFYKRLDDTKQVKRLWTTIVERYEKAEGKDDLVIEALNELWKIATKKKDRRAAKSL